MSDKPLDISERTIFDGFIVRYIFKFICFIIFKVLGWRKLPSIPEGSGIAIAAPHTSNWDFVFALSAAILSNIKIYFSIKDSWCRRPLVGSFILWLGAIPIDRSKGAHGQADKIRCFIENYQGQRAIFLFTPEGTRGNVRKWKTGFYHVAQASGLPLFLAKVDYIKKEAGVFHSFQLTGHKRDDIQAIQESYRGICGKYPSNQYPPYVGPFPDISDAEATIMRAMFSFKGVATQMEIAARSKMNEFSNTMLNFMIEKGVIEQALDSYGRKGEPAYQLTFVGIGCLLHLYPTLA